MPKRLQRKRTKGWRKPKGAVIVDRTSWWGNPFKITTDEVGYTVICDSIKGFHGIGFMNYQSAARKSCQLYRNWLQKQISDKKLDINDLKGKDLLCFCSLDQPCHADVLMELANT